MTIKKITHGISMDKWRVEKGPGTHVLMDGGILQVPWEQLDEFYTEYIHAVRTGTRLYIVEQKTEIFKFFVDLDYKSELALSDKEVRELADLMSNVVSKPCVIARAPPRQVGRFIKSGVHFHWPDVYVTKKEALALRTRILLELPEDPEWAQRIDSSVYGGSGLRMLWSHKKEKGEDTEPYVPLDHVGPPTKEILALFAVRTNKQAETCTIELTCAPLERFIQRHLKGQSRARVRRVIRKGQNRIVVQTDSRYCERIQGEHRSNHVWFGIQGDRICQLCHDDDCKKFVGQEHILSPSIVEELCSNVAVDNSTYMSICDLVPDFWWQEESISSRSPSVLRVGPSCLESVPKPSRRIRKYKNSNRPTGPRTLCFD
jgi:hypothetical protein